MITMVRPLCFMVKYVLPGIPLESYDTVFRIESKNVSGWRIAGSVQLKRWIPLCLQDPLLLFASRRSFHSRKGTYL